jgi:chemotaxis signal transduction protein
MINRYLIFSTAQQSMGLPVSEVTEIIPMVLLTTVPLMPSFLVGFLDWDDGTPPLPVLQVAKVLQLPQEAQVPGLHTPIIVVGSAGFGLLVESISGFVSGTMVAQDDRVPRNSFNGCVLGLLNTADTAEPVPILSVESLLLAEEQERLTFFQQLLGERKAVLSTAG